MLKGELKLLLLILILAGGLRFAGITFDSLWLDESYQSLVEATGAPLPDFCALKEEPWLFQLGKPRPVASLLANFRQVDPLCPPLYAVLLNRWMVLFGGSDLAVRSLSLVFSLCSIVALFFLGRSIFGPRSACLSALVQALSPFDIFYAQEARMYSLTILTSTLSGAFFFWLTAGGYRSMRKSIFCAAGYAVSTFALINSHYTALFVVAFQALSALCLCLLNKDKRLLAWVSLAFGGALVLSLPWFDLFRQAALVRTESFYVARKPSWWWPIWALVARIPFNFLTFLVGKKVVAYAVPLYVTGAAMLVLALPHFRRLSPGLLYIFSWALTPAIFIWILDLIEGHRVLEISRYLIATAPPVYLLAAVGLASLSLARFRVLMILHAVFAIANNTYAHLVAQREPWREMAAIVERRCKGDLLVVSHYYDIVCLNRYLKQPLKQVGFSPAMGQKQLDAILNGRFRFWLLTAQEGDQVVPMIPARFRQRVRIDLSHALHLFFYEMEHY